MSNNTLRAIAHYSHKTSNIGKYMIAPCLPQIHSSPDGLGGSVYLHITECSLRFTIEFIKIKQKRRKSVLFIAFSLEKYGF